MQRSSVLMNEGYGFFLNWWDHQSVQCCCSVVCLFYQKLTTVCCTRTAYSEYMSVNATLSTLFQPIGAAFPLLCSGEAEVLLEKGIHILVIPKGSSSSSILTVHGGEHLQPPSKETEAANCKFKISIGYKMRSCLRRSRREVSGRRVRGGERRKKWRMRR